MRSGQQRSGQQRSGQPKGLGSLDSASLLPRAFYEHPPERVAPRLLGKLLVHRADEAILAGRIVEAEAYLGPHNSPPDPAAHAHRGPTPRCAVLFGPPGHAYVYSIYGQYFCLNVSCEPEGRAGCVLLRALEPLAGLEKMSRNRGVESAIHPRVLTSGPSRLCQALGLTRAQHNALDLTSPDSPLQILDDGFADLVASADLHVGPRIGIKHAIDWPLRFCVAGHVCASGPRKGNGSKQKFPGA